MAIPVAPDSTSRRAWSAKSFSSLRSTVTYASTGRPPWETYLTDPGEHPDPETWETEIVQPIAGAHP